MLTVFTEEVFDLLHANHLRLLAKARSMGDRLLVGVTPDDHAARYKRRPILTQAERIEAVRTTGLADEVILSPCMDGPGVTRTFIEAHCIGLVVYAGTGWQDHFSVPSDMGIMRRLPYRDGINTSTIIARIRARDDL